MRRRAKKKKKRFLRYSEGNIGIWKGNGEELNDEVGKSKRERSALGYGSGKRKEIRKMKEDRRTKIYNAGI